MKITNCLIVQALTAALVRSVDAQGPLKIADYLDIVISSNDEESEVKCVTSEDGTTDTYTLTYPDASHISVHFSDFDLPSACSFSITDGKKSKPYVLTGKGKADLGVFWGRHVPGDRMVMSLSCREDKDQATFKIDQFAAGYPGLGGNSSSSEPVDDKPSFLETVEPLSICGTDDKVPAKCYQTSEPDIYGKARAVARVIINGGGLCTGWLFTAQSHLATNEHCINTFNDAVNSDYQFMYETPSCSGTGTDPEMEIFDANAFLAVSAEWDYAVMKLVGDPASKFGHLEMDNRQPPVDEQIFIPQHPGGRRKELGIFDDQYDGNCRVLTYGGGCAPEDMKYTCDTEGGSSGSPVLSRVNNKVVALHHCGGACNGNLGAPIYRIYDAIMLAIGTYSTYPSASPAPSTAPCDPSVEDTFDLYIKSDNYPEDISWGLYDMCDDNATIVYENNPIDSGGGEYTKQVCLDKVGKYRATIFDSFGDGLCCSYGDGAYSFSLNGEAMDEGGEFTTEASHEWGSCTAPPVDPPSDPPVDPPSDPPVEPPVDYECVDSPLKFKFDKADGGKTKFTKCKNMDTALCGIEKNERSCPMTCGKCNKCKDSKNKFKTDDWDGKTKKKKCSNVDSETKCGYEGMKETCRGTCSEWYPEVCPA